MGSISQLVIFIDPTRCLACKACEVACATEHSITKSTLTAHLETPKPSARIRVVPVDTIFSIPMRCQHCTEAPCEIVCPTKAIYRSPEGFVLLNAVKCIGCGMCSLACPFGHPKIDVAVGKAVKCDFCVDRVRKGLMPACVEACPTGALRYGYLEDFLRELSASKAKELVSGKATPGKVYVRVVTEETTPSKLIELRQMYSSVSWG
ncbi:MAG: 4Fe-4S ferredoxin [Zestosphaera tikiterensis]|uniref:4Fe-4S ferredoxin n=1 Tax=Zestosphaera tikiterensis TaxID=1973259 RepID=A0A2R7Y2R6_9CREN|nr:MAG: 4Fe-4S ferredoxin [Zestosphaera tikiterensis]